MLSGTLTKNVPPGVIAIRERGRELTKKMQDRETLITNLQQSARLLEDQLRLMDSRYLELRGKLDYTKSSSENEVRERRVAAGLTLIHDSSSRICPLSPAPGASRAAGAPGRDGTLEVRTQPLPGR